MPADGVEHHESSDNRTPEELFLDPDVRESQMDLLAHEFTHSWNGKFRRPAGLVIPNYQVPMRGELLWVYEGLTQYYGVMLSARAGFWTPARLREYLASTAAYLDDRPGRTWRDLQDTAIAAQLLYNASTEGSSWRRSVDYYDESTLIWLEADTIIRQETKNKKSLDDFCRTFHGGENSGPKVVPYTFDDVVAGMQAVTPYDWRGFFTERLSTHGPGAPLGGLQNSGWKLVYSETDERTSAFRRNRRSRSRCAVFVGISSARARGRAERSHSGCGSGFARGPSRDCAGNAPGGCEWPEMVAGNSARCDPASEEQ